MFARYSQITPTIVDKNSLVVIPQINADADGDYEPIYSSIGPFSLFRQDLIDYLFWLQGAENETVERIMDDIVTSDLDKYTEMYAFDEKFIIPFNIYYPCLVMKHKNKQSINKPDSFNKDEYSGTNRPEYLLLAEYFNQETFSVSGITPKYNQDTLPCSVFVTGTACVGKTTIISKMIDLCKEFNPDILSLKSGRRGQIRHKDNSIFQALNFQLSIIADAFISPYALYDRSFIDNLLWRIIMAMFGFDTQKEALEYAVDCLLSLPLNILKPFMQKIPIFIVVSTNTPRTREMMKNRQEGGDLKRGILPNYVEYQNVVYGLFGAMCEIPLYGNSEAEIVEMAGHVQQELLHRRNLVNTTPNFFKISPELQTIHLDEEKKLKRADVLSILK